MRDANMGAHPLRDTLRLSDDKPACGGLQSRVQKQNCPSGGCCHTCVSVRVCVRVRACHHYCAAAGGGRQCGRPLAVPRLLAAHGGARRRRHQPTPPAPPQPEGRQHQEVGKCIQSPAQLT